MAGVEISLLWGVDFTQAASRMRILCLHMHLAAEARSWLPRRTPEKERDDSI